MQHIRVCAAVQVAPNLRIPPRNSRNLMEASFTTRTRRAPAASCWHSSYTGMSLPCAQKHPSKLAHSDGNRAARRSLVTRAQSGPCRPICADYSAHKLHVRCAIHRGCMRAAGICWVAPGKPPLVARLCGYNRDRANPTTTAAPEWPPRAAVWHETRTRAAGMHAEYVWPSYAAQLRRCPRVSACVPDWVCLQASCSADSQKISLLGW